MKRRLGNVVKIRAVPCSGSQLITVKIRVWNIRQERSDQAIDTSQSTAGVRSRKRSEAASKPRD